MMIGFYIAAVVAIICTVMVISRFSIIHALLNLVVSFLAVAVIFFTLGAPFAAALEIIIYAGAIVVLIIFVIMMLNQRDEEVQQEKEWLKPSIWIMPGILSAVLLLELIFVLPLDGTLSSGKMVDVKAVGISLYGEYILGVELSGMLLMAGIVGAYHLGRQRKKVTHRFLEKIEE